MTSGGRLQQLTAEEAQVEKAQYERVTVALTIHNFSVICNMTYNTENDAASGAMVLVSLSLSHPHPVHLSTPSQHGWTHTPNDSSFSSVEKCRSFAWSQMPLLTVDSTCGAELGYSMPKTGFPASMNG